MTAFDEEGTEKQGRKGMQALVAKAVHTFRNFRSTASHHYGNGVLGVLKMGYHSLFRINTFVLYERELDDSVLPVRFDPEFRIIKPTIKELQAIREGRDLPREFYYDRFHGVRNCYIVLCGDEPAYIHWVYMKGDPNRFLRLGTDVAEFNYNTTLPKFRGRKLMVNVMLYMMNDLKQLGIRKVVGVVNALNPPALRSCESAEFRETKKIRTLGYLNWKYDITV